MKTKREIYAESFADYVVDAMKRTNLRQADIASRTGLSRQVVSQIAGKKPNSRTGKLMLPERETVDAIAKAFGDPISVARKAAGYDASEISSENDGENLEVGVFIEQAVALFNKIPKVHRKKVLSTIVSIFGEETAPIPAHEVSEPRPVFGKKPEDKTPNGKQERK